MRWFGYVLGSQRRASQKNQLLGLSGTLLSLLSSEESCTKALLTSSGLSFILPPAGPSGAPNYPTVVIPLTIRRPDGSAIAVEGGIYGDPGAKLTLERLRFQNLQEQGGGKFIAELALQASPQRYQPPPFSPKIFDVLLKIVLDPANSNHALITSCGPLPPPSPPTASGSAGSLFTLNSTPQGTPYTIPPGKALVLSSSQCMGCPTCRCSVNNVDTLLVHMDWPYCTSTAAIMRPVSPPVYTSQQLTFKGPCAWSGYLTDASQVSGGEFFGRKVASSQKVTYTVPAGKVLELNSVVGSMRCCFLHDGKNTAEVTGPTMSAPFVFAGGSQITLWNKPPGTQGCLGMCDFSGVVKGL